MMKIFRRSTSFVLAIVLLLLTFVPVLAAPANQAGDSGTDRQAGVICSDGVCEISLALDAVSGVPTPALQLAAGALRVAEKNVKAVPDGTALEVSDRVTLSLPVGNIEMFNADLDVERTEEGDVERFYGTAAVPLPTLGILDELQLVAPGRALVAYDTGEALAHLGAPMDPERNYLALHFGADTGSLTDPAFSFTGGEGQNSLLVIIDPVDRLVHAVGNVMLLDTVELLLPNSGLAEGAGLTPGLLPLPERLGVRLALLVSEDLSETEMELSTGYAVTGGPLAARFGLDVEPVAFEGTLTLNNDGVALQGKARSTLEPDELFGTEGTATIQVPLLGSDQQASLVLRGNVDVPIFSFSEGGDVTLTMPEVPVDEAVAAVRSQVDASTSGMREGVEWVAVSTASRVPGSSELREGMEWVAVSAADRIGQSGGAAAQATQDSVKWATDFVGNAVDFAVDNADEGAGVVADLWCTRLGRCDPPATAATGE